MKQECRRNQALIGLGLMAAEQEGKKCRKKYDENRYGDGEGRETLKKSHGVAVLSKGAG